MKQDFLLIRNIFLHTISFGPGHFIQLFVSSSVISFLGLSLPLIILQIYDRVIPYNAIETLTWLILGGVLAVFLEALLKYSRIQTTTQLSDEFEYNTGKELFKNILTSKNLREKKPGTLIEVFNSLSYLRNLYSGEMFQSLLDFPFAILFIIIIFTISPIIAIYITLVVLFYFILSTYFLRPLIIKYQHEENDLEKKNLNFLLDVFSSVLKIKTNHCEEWKLRQTENNQKEYAEFSFKKGNLEIVKNVSTQFISQFIFFGVIAIGAYLVTTQKLTIGQLTACSFMARRIFQPTQSLCQLFISLEKYGHYENIVNEYLNKVNSTTDSDEEKLDLSTRQISGVLRAQNLRLVDNSKLIVNNLNYQFKLKELTFIHSSEIAESTALARLLAGQITPDEGLLTIDSVPFERLSSESLNNNVAYVPPKGTFIKGTVIENITLFNPAKNDLAQDCIGMLGQMNMISELPSGFETMIDSRNIVHYPRLPEVITLARELIKRPRIIILDRIDELMDREDLNSYQWLLTQLKGKITTIVISKNPEFKNICDQYLEYTNSTLTTKRHSGNN